MKVARNWLEPTLFTHWGITALLSWLCLHNDNKTSWMFKLSGACPGIFTSAWTFNVCKCSTALYNLVHLSGILDFERINKQKLMLLPRRPHPGRVLFIVILTVQRGTNGNCCYCFGWGPSWTVAERECMCPYGHQRVQTAGLEYLDDPRSPQSSFSLFSAPLFYSVLLSLSLYLPSPFLLNPKGNRWTLAETGGNQRHGVNSVLKSNQARARERTPRRAGWLATHSRV